MDSRTTINKIAMLNRRSISQKHNFDVIQYLDTGNITENKIDNIQYLRVGKDKIPSRAKRLVKDKTIIYSSVRPNQKHFGYIVEPDKNFVVSTGFTTIDVVDENYDPKYLYYVLTQEHITNHLHRIGENSVSSYPSINPDDIGLLRFNFPSSIKEQEKKADVLSVIDAKIELNNRINAELEAMAKTLYDYWFMQFDFPDANGKPYKTSGGKMVYNSTLKREIPEGWEHGPLVDWIAHDKTGDWGKESVQGNYTLQVDCVRGADINGLNGTGKVAAPNRFILNKNSHKILSPYNFIIEISGGSPTQSTGRMAFIIEETLDRFKHPLICSNFCKAISLKDKVYFYNFAYQWSSIYENGILFGWEGKMSGIKNLLFDAFVTKYIVCYPPKDLAQKYYNFVEPIQQKKQKILKENDGLVTLRDWLLPMLMNGQVSVK